MNTKFCPLVSIIIPVYNGSNYMKEAIDSALAQTYKNIEIIVVNDGSTDNTDEIARSYGDKIRYFKKENGGVATALNLAIKEAKGDYISWLSHDDVYLPNKIEAQVKKLDELKDKNTIILSNYFLFYPDGKETKHSVKDAGYNSDNKESIITLLFCSGLHGCSLLIPKIAFTQCGYFDEKLKTTQDYDLWFKFIKNNYKFSLVDEFLVKGRQHDKQDTKSKIKLCKKERKQLFKKAIKQFSTDILQMDRTNFSITARALKNIHLKHDLILLKLKKLIKRTSNDNIYCQLHNNSFSCLQIGDNDLLGNKFNGHDLHLYLREKNINAEHIVIKKRSKDVNTFHFNETENFSSNILKSDLFSNSDIVHLHLIHNTSFEITHLPIFSALKPTVITLHDPFFTTGHCIHSFGCEKWKQSCKDCPRLDIPFILDNDSTALNFKVKKDSIQNSQISAIVASDYMENLVKQSPIWKGKKIYKLPFGINQEIFKPVDKTHAKKNLGINKDNIVLMFRSSSLPYKGIETIKNALRNLKTDKKITVITVNEKRNFKEFKNKFKIKEYGWVYDDKKLAQLYQAADIFLMPSEQEAFGLMAIEAMSSKVPVISIKGTSLESVTNAPECGICCEKEDFSNELNRLINNADEIKLRAEKSYQYAKENYDKEVYIKRMIEIYQDIIKNHKIEPEWQDVLGQMEKYNINNYYVDNKIAIAKNPIWKLIYRLLIRPFLKKKYDKKTLKTRFDRKYL